MREEDLHILKQNKLQQMKEQIEHQAALEAQLKMVLNILLTEKAKERLMNVRLVNKELYLKAAQYIIMMYRTGKLKGKLEESALIQLLKALSPRKEMKIVRK